MKTKNLLALISVIEILFLVMIDVLGNRLAELIQLSPVAVLGLTLGLVTILACITFYKIRIADTETVSISFPKTRIHLTQHSVKTFVFWLAYSPFAILVSSGAFHLAKELESGWTALLPGIAVSGTIFAYPLFHDLAVQQKHRLFPVFIAWVLSLIYGGTGFLVLLFQNLLDTHLLVLLWVTAITMTGLKYAYVFELLDTVVSPWYRKLPKN
jgi:hypothetical protein